MIKQSPLFSLYKLLQYQSQDWPNPISIKEGGIISAGYHMTHHVTDHEPDRRPQGAGHGNWQDVCGNWQEMTEQYMETDRMSHGIVCGNWQDVTWEQVIELTGCYVKQDMKMAGCYIGYDIKTDRMPHGAWHESDRIAHGQSMTFNWQDSTQTRTNGMFSIHYLLTSPQLIFSTASSRKKKYTLSSMSNELTKWGSETMQKYIKNDRKLWFYVSFHHHDDMSKISNTKDGQLEVKLVWMCTDGVKITIRKFHGPLTFYGIKT